MLNGTALKEEQGGDREEDRHPKQKSYVWYLERPMYEKCGVVFVGNEGHRSILLFLSRRRSNHLLAHSETAVIPVTSKQAQCLAHSMA